jgi:hypothetical protein
VPAWRAGKPWIGGGEETERVRAEKRIEARGTGRAVDAVSKAETSEPQGKREKYLV